MQRDGRRAVKDRMLRGRQGGKLMTYTIRQVATQFHMQPSTLRYYEEQGLLTNVDRTETGQIAARISTNARYAGKYINHENM